MSQDTAKELRDVGAVLELLLKTGVAVVQVNFANHVEVIGLVAETGRRISPSIFVS